MNARAVVTVRRLQLSNHQEQTDLSVSSFEPAANETTECTGSNVRSVVSHFETRRQPRIVHCVET